MTHDDVTQGELAAPQVRKLRLGVMGEFSAGKSTLCNLLLGARPLTERVTATRLSPVWITKGSLPMEREFLDGSREALDGVDLESVPIEGTRSIRLYDDAEVLDMFDLVDFPGISDPNMPTEVWERLVPEIDIVLWCTHANQAWRQSEAEVWRSFPNELKARSLLLVTRFDTLTSERDKARVLARVRHETESEFAGLFPIALTDAIAAVDDPEAWAESGAEPFIAHLVDVIADLQLDLEQGRIEERPAYVERAAPEPRDDATPVADPVASAPSGDARPAPEAPAADLGPVAAELAAHHVSHDDGADLETRPDEPTTPAHESDAPVKVKSPISLMPRRGAAETNAAPAILPRRVTAQGMRRTERPRGEAAVRSLRIDDLKVEETVSQDDLRSAFTPQ